MGPINIYQSQEALLLTMTVIINLVVKSEEKGSSAVMTLPELNEMAEAIIKARNIYFDYVYLLVEDEGRIDSFSGIGEGPFRMVPTFKLEPLTNRKLNEDYEQDGGNLSKIRNKMLVIWDYRGTALSNLTFVLSALPKKYPSQELWILDGSENDGELKSVMEYHPDSVPFTSQTYLFNRESESDFVLVSEAYSLPGNAYGNRKPMLIVRELVTYNFSNEELIDFGGWWSLDDSDSDADCDATSWVDSAVALIRRRADLRNISLSMVVEDTVPACVVDPSVRPGHETTKVKGSYIDLANELAAELNFRPVFVRSPSPLWTDLVSSLARAEYDLSATESGFTLDRSNIVDFSTPIDITNYMLFVQKPRRSLSWTTYLTPFNAVFWIFAALNVFFCSLALYFATNTKSSGISLNLSYLSCLAMCVLAMVNIGVDVMPTRASSRILFLGILICGTVFWASFQASLTSTLTVIISHLPINGLQDALDKGFQMAVWEGTAIEEIMANSPVGSAPRKAWDEVILKESNTKVTAVEGMARAADDDNFAFIVSKREAEFDPDFYPCNITYIPGHQVAVMSAGIIYSKGFQLKPLFDFYINKMLESGQIHRIMSRWELQAKDCGATEISIGFENIVSAFAALATGVGVALLVTVAERVNGQCCCCSSCTSRQFKACLWSCVE